jgi:hypothetical protein
MHYWRTQAKVYCPHPPNPSVARTVVLIPTSSPCAAQRHPHHHHHHLQLQLSPTECSQHRITRSADLPTTCNSTDDKQRDHVFARGPPQGTGQIHHYYTSPLCKWMRTQSINCRLRWEGWNSWHRLHAPRDHAVGKRDARVVKSVPQSALFLLITSLGPLARG